MSRRQKHAVIIGAGPAGLTAGIELLKDENFSVEILERDNIIGGLARTTEYKGCRYDIGPHHFITHADEVMQWWTELMGDDFHPHKRFTRIYYNKHFFNYPLEPLNVITGLSLSECIKCIASYLKARIFPIKPVKSFQDWVTNRFGYRLFSIFFKTYTEKVWGIACEKISADWASQRIKGFSLSKAIFYAFFGKFFKKNIPRTIQDTFYYPSLGSGTLWEKAAKNIKEHKFGSVTLSRQVVAIEHAEGAIKAVYSKDPVHNQTQQLYYHTGDYFLSTMPLRTLIKSLDPLPSQEVIQAADALRYRGLITINLIVNKADVIPDHWLYVHEKSVKMGRIGNMNNFSMQMSDHHDHTALSLEYFTFIEDSFWHMTEHDLVELGKRELEHIGIAKASAVLDGMVIKVPEAYPVYDAHYHTHLTTVLSYLKTFSNLKLMGRNGLHRYNNMDIAMLSAFDVVKEIRQYEMTKVKKDSPSSAVMYS